MIKNKKSWINLTGGVVAALCMAAPFSAEAASSLKTPGVQADIAKQEEKADIAQQDAEQAKSGSEVPFSIGKIKLMSEVIKLKDYSEIISRYENRIVTIKELNELAEILTLDLRSDGYPAALIYVPNQNIVSGGDINLTVMPGRYGKVAIENDSNLPQAVAEGYLAGLRQGEVIRGISLESAINKLTRVGGVRASGMLSPGSEVGTTDLTIKLEKGKPASEIVYAENYGTTTAGRYHYGLQGDVQLPETTGTFNYALVFSNGGQHNYNFGYMQDVGRSGTKLGINISRSDYDLGGIYKIIGATGNALTLNVNGTTPFFYTWNDSMSLNYGYNYRKLNDEQETFHIDTKKHSHSAYIGINGVMRRGKAAVSYNLTDTWGTLGFDNDDARMMYNMSDTEGTFNKISLNASYLQTFDKHFDFLAKFSGQLSSKNLDGSEEIVLGGINGVRAYPAGIGSGDEGYVANFEFCYHTDIPGLTLSTYFDSGHVKVVHDTDSMSYGGETAMGWGIGVAYTKPNCYFARIDYARRIGGLSYYKEDAESKARGRLWFMVGAMF